MSEHGTIVPEARDQLIFGLHDSPAAGKAIVAALQHLAAIFLGFITPAIVLNIILPRTYTQRLLPKDPAKNIMGQEDV
jgi:xanthine/uracil permease